MGVKLGNIVCIVTAHCYTKGSLFLAAFEKKVQKSAYYLRHVCPHIRTRKELN
jgi:hypothetical protein